MRYRSYFFNILFLILLLSAEADAFKIIRSGSYEGLADSTGEVLIPPVYDAIGWSNGQTDVLDQLIGYKEADRWGLITVRNKKLSSTKFTVLLPFDNQNVKAAIKGDLSNNLFYGLIDQKGRVYVDFKYFSIDRLTDLTLKVSEYSDRSVKYGVSSYTGVSLVPRQYHRIDTLGDMFVGTLGRKLKLFKADGQPVFDFWVDEVKRTDDGVLVKKEGRYGLVSSDGNVIHKVAYKKVEGGNVFPFQTWIIQTAGAEELEVACDSLEKNPNETWTAFLNGQQHLLTSDAIRLADFNEYRLVDNREEFLLLQNQSNLKWAVFNKKSEELVSGKDSIALDDAYFYVKEKGKWDVYNYFGRKLNDRPLDRVLGSQGRMVGAKKYKYWGWMNFTGENQIEYKYDSIKKGLNEDQFIAQYVGKWGVSNFHGEYIILPEYDRLTYHGQFYVAYKGNAAHIFNAQGKYIYVTTSKVGGESVLRMQNDGLHGAIFSEQNIFYPIYDSIQQVADYYAVYSDGFAAVQDAAGENVFTVAAGIQQVYGYCEDFFLIRKDNKFGLVDGQGRLLIANRYDSAQCFSEDMAAIQLLGRWGFVDKMESLKVQPFYDEVSPFRNGRAIVRKGNKYGIIDKNGREVLPMEWARIERKNTGNYILIDSYGRYGVADIDGGIILSPIFEHIEDVGDNKLIVQKIGNKGIMTYDGYTTTPFKYDRIKVLGEHVLLLDEQLY